MSISRFEALLATSALITAVIRLGAGVRGSSAPNANCGIFDSELDGVMPVSAVLLTAIAVFLFGVPVRGSFPTLCAAAFLYVIAATTFGLVVSSFVRSQIAALFGTAVLTILPAVQFSGMIDPVSALEGVGRVIGELYPTTHFLTIARGTFSKGLDFHDLRASFVPLLVAVPVLLALATALVRKQER